MNLDSRKPFQVFAIILAGTMLASYVVYSQRQAAQTMAPSSKVMILNPPSVQAQKPATNQPASHSTSLVAPGSKSAAPLISLPGRTTSTTSKRHMTNAPAAPQSLGPPSATTNSAAARKL